MTQDDAAIGPARREIEAGDRCRIAGDPAAAVRHYGLALQSDPYDRDAFCALVAMGEAERAYEVARQHMTPGISASPRTMGGPLAVFTVSSNNYAAHARVLLDSVSQHYPDAERFHIVVDRQLLDAADYADGCHTIRACEIGIPDFDLMAFRYDVTELNTAVKPFAFRHLMEVERFDTVLYFDPDVQVFARSTSILEALGDGASAVLTPHFTVPPAALDEPNDQTMLRSGAYNLGFLGLRISEESRRLLEWWSRHLQYKCRDQQARGLFVDQRFFDLAKGYFEHVRVCRSNGANVAYWNLNERPLTVAGGVLHAGGAPLEFFHFSGCDPRDPRRLSKYTRRYSTLGDPTLAELVAGYRKRLEQSGFGRFAAIPYSYDHFYSGRPIPKALRETFADSVLLWKGDPFETAESRPPSDTRAPTQRRGPRRNPSDRPGLSVPGTKVRRFGSALCDLALGYYFERRRDFARATDRYVRSLATRPDWMLPFRQLAAIGEAEHAYDLGRRMLQPGAVAAPCSGGGTRALFTIAANCRAAHAKVLLDSLAEHYPDAQRFLFVVDRELPPQADRPTNVHVVNSREIGVPGFEAMAFRFDRMELSALVKPFAFQHLFDVEKFETAVFFAPDALVLGPSQTALDALAQGSSVVLTPRFTTPTAARGEPNELSALRLGAFDTGFMAMRRCDEAAAVLAWWSRSLLFKAHRRSSAGMYLDSKPLDLAAGYFDGLHIHRSDGANVGPWNLPERMLTRDDHGLRANGAPLEFVRFDVESETDGRSPTRCAVYEELAVHYARLLDESGAARLRSLPYSYDYLLSGRKIPATMRAMAADRLLYGGSHPFDDVR